MTAPEDIVDLERLQRLHTAIGRYDAAAKLAGILTQYRATTDAAERATLLADLVTGSQTLAEHTPEHIFAVAVRTELTKLTSSDAAAQPASMD
jgi:hypothetical protein